MEKKFTADEPACKKDYVVPEMKVEALRARTNLLEGSVDGPIDVIIREQ